MDVDEIINNYIENTGGIDAWSALKGVKSMAKVNNGGMEIPLEIVQLSDGRQYSMINFQGNTIMQGVFDGETLWNTNFQTMKAEKADASSRAAKNLLGTAGVLNNPIILFAEPTRVCWND